MRLQAEIFQHSQDSVVVTCLPSYQEILSLIPAQGCYGNAAYFQPEIFVMQISISYKVRF